MEKLNIAEILKDCPSGMELDCTMYDNVTFDKVSDDEKSVYPIFCYITDEKGNRSSISFTENGCESKRYGAKCVIFPKGKTTWEGFQRPFKDGDIVTWKDRGSLVAFIYKERKDVAVVKHHFALYTGSLGTVTDGELSLVENEIVFATEEEKQKLFDAIKANGYKWNAETKTLEKLPKFKVGDEIVKDRGVTFLVDRKAVIFLIGSQMDYQESDLESGFVFRNPNEKGRCGCGESFHI